MGGGVHGLSLPPLFNMIDTGWYVYPNSREPERKRVTDDYYNVFYYFNSYGEAWCYLILRYARLSQRRYGI